MDEHQSVNGTQLSSLQEYIDNGYATFIGGGATSSSSGQIYDTSSKNIEPYDLEEEWKKIDRWPFEH